uniref:Uncharacterized protein n=1 Tax=viral metagenome TaxID=1070528 RepID=A0A6C0H2Z4_9ZZZZ
MDTEDQINDTATQNDTMDNNMIANMLNSLMSRNLQQESKSIQKDEDEDSDDDDDEAEEDSDEEDSDDDEEEWIALQKLLDSHLRITKCLLHLVKKK